MDQYLRDTEMHHESGRQSSAKRLVNKVSTSRHLPAVNEDTLVHPRQRELRCQVIFLSNPPLRQTDPEATTHLQECPRVRRQDSQAHRLAVTRLQRAVLRWRRTAGDAAPRPSPTMPTPKAVAP
ncbi:hypothetical protein E2C01_011593 [Portunus trituberculatus]|uniref:Uncharacterized protein n=1 Tax=Portunus trituberculatus TaxID=210409 RepID=A0A5B7DBT7_PORTR|nr:hypothetical protein [Portunus trituberculatus]